MKNKIIRVFVLCIAVALLSAGGFFAFGLTKDRSFLEAATAAGILFGVLVLADISFAVVAVRERKRSGKGSGRKDPKDGED